MYPLEVENNPQGNTSLQTALASIRKHLGMDVAYISEFVGDQSVYREVDAPGLEALVKVGDRRSLDDVYCRHILAGRLPELMTNAADFELARSMPVTQAVPIGAHMSVPIKNRDGVPVGMFCCMSPRPDRSLNERDLQVMRVFADMAARQISEQAERERGYDEKRAVIQEIVDRKSFSLVFQPICNLTNGEPEGYESLCRFTPSPYRAPDLWLKDAFDVGLGPTLEMGLAEDAIAALAYFPPPIYLSINLSPETLVTNVSTLLGWHVPFERLVFEITEHAVIEDYEALCSAVEPLRNAGARIAIDDAGAGYSGLQHILRLKPEIVKLDMSLTRAVDSDDARQALATALIFFSLKTNCLLVAEGVETPSELATLKALGIPKGQGYLLGKPVALHLASGMFDAKASELGAA